MIKRAIFLFLLIQTLFRLSALTLEVQVLDRDLDIALEGVRLIDTYTGNEVYTDAEGMATVEFDADRDQLIIVAELIGYEDSKIRVRDYGKPLVIRMVIEGVLEGEELVVEEEAIGETDEETGVSIAIDEEVIQSAAKIGIFEDAVSALKILPGVIASGPFGNYFSVRGGDPSGLSVLYDGVPINFPFHFGGMVSIFNPNVIESIKFSPGIFSAEYGQATSGIVEVTTVNPNEGFRLESISSTSTLEFFLQAPLDKLNHSGLFVGTRLTNFDIAFALVRGWGNLTDDQDLLDMVDGISTVPYIRDFYLKTFVNPDDKFKWYLNAFYGNDGIGVQQSNEGVDTSEQIVTDAVFNYYNSDLILNTGFGFLPANNFLIDLVLGYEFYRNDISVLINEYGTMAYSDEFIAMFSPPDTTFTVDMVSDYDSSTLKHTGTAKLDFDLALSDNYLLQWGLGSILDYDDFSGGGRIWMLNTASGTPSYELFSYEPGRSASWTLDSHAYLTLSAWFVPEIFKIDAGVRIDHSYFHSDGGMSINTTPVVSPRLNMTWSPKTDNSFFRTNTFSLGAGFFAKNPFSSNMLSEEMSPEDIDIAVPKTIMGIVGWDTGLPAGFSFKIEAYYKYMYDRFYFNFVDMGSTTGIVTHNDGFGHSAGFDLVLRRKVSRLVFGMLSYTFNYTRMKYPQTDGLDPEASLRDIWLYPDYHHFHTFNLFLDIKPTNVFTLTTKLSFSTGAPVSEFGDMIMFPAMIVNEDSTTTLAEMYAQTSSYSDTLRDNIDITLDLKAAFSNYYKHSKVEWEFYVAVENVLAPLMAELFPDNQIPRDKWGNESDTGDGPPSLNIPIPSIGFKLSY